MPPGQKGLPMDAFLEKKKTRSLPFDTITSTRPTPSWHSTTASNIMVPTADLQMFRAVEQR